ncbi:NAD(P)H-dependent oxidoreductase [Isoptericola sp. 4D.3]|jgi:FMN reductase|uniref:NAD(P)H-dependent oxidoreductase n=1 Tax=Isoptericola peretonis TaxID=2918523 RepID=A0ABT0J3L4_9MICO|nr:NAD(P)H-dependent oxidoreductase [Isoptericola sp. 4D.3]
MTEPLTEPSEPLRTVPEEVVVLVGNPRPRSRTRAAAESVGRAVAAHRGLEEGRTIDLADLAPGLLLPDRPEVDEALGAVASARYLVVATPVYKASYTGLLKVFLDRFGPRGLDGVPAVPLVVSASPAHARAGDDHLRPLLVELGAAVPPASFALLESELGGVDQRAADWVSGWLGDPAPGRPLEAAR